MMLIAGVVVRHTYAHTEHRTHHLAPDVAEGCLSRDRGGLVRGGDLLGNRQVWLGAGLRSVRDGRPGEGIWRTGTGSEAIREDIRDDQGVQEDVPVSSGLLDFKP